MCDAFSVCRRPVGGAENAGVENAGVEKAGAITYGKPSEQKTLKIPGV